MNWSDQAVGTMKHLDLLVTDLLIVFDATQSGNTLAGHIV